MNCWQAYSRPSGTMFQAIVRRVDRAEPYVLKETGGRVLQFESDEAAELAAHRHILHLLNTEPNFIQPMKRVGKAAAIEAVFGEIHTKGGRTEVKRKRNRRRRRAAAAAAAE